MIQSSPYLKLPFSFDVARLRRDLASVETSGWVSHFNTGAYEKHWGCIPLRSVGGLASHIMPVDGAFQDTPILAQCPYFREVIDSFCCEKTSIRLMSLEPGGVIKEHRDEAASIDDGMTRLHVPVQTCERVMFRIEGEEVHFTAGDTWYLNASCLHGVQNRGTEPRVHLMLDCITNPWLEAVFAAAGGVRRPSPKYPDPSINDHNVLEVIARLRASGHEIGASMADRLQAIHAGGHS